jgi:hypothetical protein
MRSVLFWAAIVQITVFPDALLACSPPHDVVDLEAWIAAIQRPPYFLGGISAVAAGLWLLLRRGRNRGVWAVVLIGLALFQPAWWVPPGRADCGLVRDGLALLTATVSLTVLGVGIWRARPRRGLTLEEARPG